MASTFILHWLDMFFAYAVTLVGYLRFHEHALPFLQSQSSLCKMFKDFFQIF